MSHPKILAVTLFVLCAVGQITSHKDGPIVSTYYGDLRGYSAMDRLNRTYDAFVGVRFAKPPLGPLRWQPSQLPDPWDGIQNATEFSDHCIQRIAPLFRFLGLPSNDSEDCLYLNIWIPISVADAVANPRPVMIFITGGGYQLGTGSMYPSEELAVTGDVVAITISYRLNVMGFFSTGDAAAPGNYGLYDGKTALEWVRQNVAGFGGDPNRITLFGQSVGGGSVSHMVISPLTNNLFHRAIAMSGAAAHDDNPKLTSDYIARLFNCSSDNSYEVVECLRTVDAKEMHEAYSSNLLTSGGEVPLTTVIDGTFVIGDTRESFEAGMGSHIDFMNGYCHHDQAGFVVGNAIGLPRNRSDDDGNKNAKQLYRYVKAYFISYDNVDEIMETLYDRFPCMNDSEPAVASECVTRVMTDYVFASKVFYQAERHSENQGTGSSYFYEFRHRQNFLYGYPDWVNGSHLDDLYTVFGEPFFKPYRDIILKAPFSEDDHRLSEAVMKYYANFAYSGNPNSGRHDMPVFWPEYALSTREIMIETPNLHLLPHTQEILDHYNWFLYDFHDLLNPEMSATTSPSGDFIKILKNK